MSKKDTMFALVERWHKSTMSEAEFAADNGMAARTLARWCKRYKESKLATQNKASEFIEITSQLQSQDSNILPELRLAKIDIELPCGLRIKIY